jgi:hypothetical protein
MIIVIWQPTWEAAELLLANFDFKTYVDSYKNADTSTQLNAQSEDQEIDKSTKQGYDGCTHHFENMWDLSQGQNIRDKAIYHGHWQSPSRHSTHLEMWDLGAGCGPPQARI